MQDLNNKKQTVIIDNLIIEESIFFTIGGFQ